MKHAIAAFLLTTFCSCALRAQQDELPLRYAGTITIEDLHEHLSVLASDALEGRETGTRGQKMAAAYIAHQFGDYGLTPLLQTPSGKSYVQGFELFKAGLSTAWVEVKDKKYHSNKDFYFSGTLNMEQADTMKVVYIGSGQATDIQTAGLKGNNVMVKSEGDRKQILELVTELKKHGAEMVFVMTTGTDESFHQMIDGYSRNVAMGKLTLPDKEQHNYFVISPTMGADMLGSSHKNIESETLMQSGQTASFVSLPSIRFEVKQEIQFVSTENVLGMVEGTDKKDEFVIVTAHYDHIGIEGTEVNNGADDDGSGTVAVLEMAQAFALAKKNGHGPRRSVIFMTLTGEEKGLLGSTYYVNHPVVPLASTVSNLNIDMIGRIDSKHTENPDYVYLIGSDKLSSELHELSEKVNTTFTQLDLDYTYNATNDPNRFYYRSDHYNFAKNNIPVIFYFNGTHPDYHKPSDTVEKINFEQLEKRTKLVFHTAWEIANLDHRPKVDAIPEEIKLDTSK
ncbi:MAG: M28 family peptidase [Cyclobacteriaceae bacterium]|nr:M28 family peptidase [Cyclobacteriaceae bacterium]